MANLRVLALACALTVPIADASAKTLVATFSGRTGSQSLPRLLQGDTLLVSGQVPLPGGALSHSTKFGVSSTRMRATIAWVSGSAGADVRLVGVNVDLFNGAGTLVASDLFQGVIAGTAVSTIDFNSLVPDAAYTLVMTGTTQAVGAYMIAVETP